MSGTARQGSFIPLLQALCPKCRSRNVHVVNCMRWHVETQEWASTSAEAGCGDCGATQFSPAYEPMQEAAASAVAKPARRRRGSK